MSNQEHSTMGAEARPVAQSDQQQAIRALIQNGPRGAIHVKYWDALTDDDREFYEGIADDMGPHWAVVAFSADGGKGPCK